MKHLARLTFAAACVAAFILGMAYAPNLVILAGIGALVLVFLRTTNDPKGTP